VDRYTGLATSPNAAAPFSGQTYSQTGDPWPDIMSADVLKILVHVQSYGPVLEEQLLKQDERYPFMHPDRHTLSELYAEGRARLGDNKIPSRIPHSSHLRFIKAPYDRSLPESIELDDVHYRIRRPQPPDSVLQNLPADMIALIGVLVGGSIRELVRLRLISVRWARGLNLYTGELRVIGVTRVPNSLSPAVIEKLCRLFPLARAVSIDIDTYGVLKMVQLRNLRALILRCPFSHVRDEELLHLKYHSDLELLELDNVSDIGVQTIAGWSTLRELRLVDCASVGTKALAEAMKLPKLESLVVLSRLFPYNHLDPELYGHILQSKTLKRVIIERGPAVSASALRRIMEMPSMTYFAVFQHFDADVLRELGPMFGGWRTLPFACGIIVSREQRMVGPVTSSAPFADPLLPPPSRLLLIPPEPPVCRKGHPLAALTKLSQCDVCRASSTEQLELASLCQECGFQLCGACMLLHHISPRAQEVKQTLPQPSGGAH
jgi:hypothetical protein